MDRRRLHPLPADRILAPVVRRGPLGSAVDGVVHALAVDRHRLHVDRGRAGSRRCHRAHAGAEPCGPPVDPHALHRADRPPPDRIRRRAVRGEPRVGLPPRHAVHDDHRARPHRDAVRVRDRLGRHRPARSCSATGGQHARCPLAADPLEDRTARAGAVSALERPVRLHHRVRRSRARRVSPTPGHADTAAAHAERLAGGLLARAHRRLDPGFAPRDPRARPSPAVHRPQEASRRPAPAASSSPAQRTSGPLVREGVIE